MKNKTMIIIAIIYSLILAGFIAGISIHFTKKILINSFNKEKIKTEKQHQEEIAQYNSRDYPVEFDEEYYRKKYQKREEISKERVDLSYQDPKDNEKYDTPESVGDMEDFFADNQISDEELSYYLEEHPDSIRIKYEYEDLFTLQGDIIHHNFYQGQPPYFNVRWLPLDINEEERKRFTLMLYAGFDSGAVALEYELLPWMNIGIMEDVRKILVDNEEKIIFDSKLGLGIDF